MNNNELINLLVTDVAAFNAYRANNELGEIDLSGANLTEVKLRWADLTGADLTGADLTEANLTEANLTDAERLDALADEADKNLENLRTSQKNLNKWQWKQ